jgi:hypothetical protein
LLAFPGCTAAEMWTPEPDYLEPPLAGEIRLSADRIALNDRRQLMIDLGETPAGAFPPHLRGKLERGERCVVLHTPSRGALYAWDMLARSDAFRPTVATVLFERMVTRKGKLKRSRVQLVVEGELHAEGVVEVPPRTAYARPRPGSGIRDDALREAVARGIRNLMIISAPEQEFRIVGLVDAAHEPVPDVHGYDADHLMRLFVLVARGPSFIVVPVPVALIASQFPKDYAEKTVRPVLDSAWEAAMRPRPERAGSAQKMPVDIVYREYRRGPRYRNVLSRVLLTPVAAAVDVATSDDGC